MAPIKRFKQESMYGLIVHQVAVSGGSTVGHGEMCTCTQIYLPLLSFNAVSNIFLRERAIYHRNKENKQFQCCYMVFNDQNT